MSDELEVDGTIPTSVPSLRTVDPTTVPILPTLSTRRASLVAVTSTTPLPSTPSPVSTTSSTLSTSESVPAISQVAVNETQTTNSKSGPNLGLALGLTFGFIGLLALVLVLVRCTFIRHRRQHRKSGQRLAYSKARYAISAPTNFTVLESGTFSGNGIERPGTSMSIQPSLEDWGNGGNGERVGSPERMRERYPFEVMSGLESGLKDKVQTMKTAQLSSRKPVPVYTVEVDTR